ncbi:MAG: hypothetical protein ABIF18_01025 [archaeon]
MSGFDGVRIVKGSFLDNILEKNRKYSDGYIQKVENPVVPKKIRDILVKNKVKTVIDFKSGLDVIIDIIPAFSGSSMNQMGAAIYLSQKVSKSLFARLFLLDDVFNEYETLELVHTEDSPVVASLKGQGAVTGDFVYYQGFRGPIKIWDVDYPDETIAYEEFKEPLNGKYAMFDEVFE